MTTSFNVHEKGLQVVFMAFYVDFCSFISGSCFLRAVGSCAEFSVEYIQKRGARAFLGQIRQYCVIAFRICAVVLLGVCNPILVHCLSLTDWFQTF